MFVAHETDQLQGFKMVDVIRAGMTRLGMHARVFKRLSEQMASMSAKLRELIEEELAACMPHRKRPKLNQ
jgi:hypothetical protein